MKLTVEELRAAGYGAKEIARAGFTLAELQKGWKRMNKAKEKEKKKKKQKQKDEEEEEEELHHQHYHHHHSIMEWGASLFHFHGHHTLGLAEMLKGEGFVAAGEGEGEDTPVVVRYTASNVLAVGVSALVLRSTLDLRRLYEAGFSARAFKEAHFTAKEVVNACCDFNAGQMRDAGYNSVQLTAVGSSLVS